ncbi:MAG: glycosyltransferase [Bacilli bacterium]|nr:glycosyltransferase [Bacilli bacterium]MDD4808719.1 glycosyltransferase [Bacilli bacterium]
MSIRFSIIIPIYNVEYYIIDCLESIDHQDYKNFEVILVNDGSTDKSKELCEEFIKFKDNYTLYNQENQGTSVARNNGIKVAKGEYLIFMDSDDLLNEGSLTSVDKEIGNSNVDILVNRFLSLEQNTKELTESLKFLPLNKYGIKPLEFYDKHVNEQEKWLAAWCCIVKKDFILKHNLIFEPGLLHEDDLWTTSIFVKANSYRLNNYCYYIYRINRIGSVMSTIKLKNAFDKIITCKKLYEIDTSRQKKVVINKRVSNLFFSIIIISQKYLSVEEIKLIKPSLIDNMIMLNAGKKKKYYFIYKNFGFSTLYSLIKFMRSIKKMIKLLLNKNEL